jgi:hypothetical protein
MKKRGLDSMLEERLDYGWRGKMHAWCGVYDESSWMYGWRNDLEGHEIKAGERIGK